MQTETKYFSIFLTGGARALATTTTTLMMDIIFAIQYRLDECIGIKIDSQPDVTNVRVKVIVR